MTPMTYEVWLALKIAADNRVSQLKRYVIDPLMPSFRESMGSTKVALKWLEENRNEVDSKAS